MASFDDVMTALKNADASGDTAGAARLAQIAQNMRQSGATPSPQTSALMAGTKSAVENTFPALTGLAGAGAALSAGSGVIAGASVINPLLGLATAGGIGLAGGLGGGYLGNKAQDLATSQIPSDVKAAAGFSPEQRALEQEQHPYASFVGELAPNALAFRPGALDPIVTASGKVISSGMQRAGMGVLGSGLEAGNEAYQGKGFDPLKIAGAGVFQAVSATPTALGKRLFPGEHIPQDHVTSDDVLNNLTTIAKKPPEVIPDTNADFYKQQALDKQQAAILEQHIQGQNPILVDREGKAFATEDGGIDTSQQRNPFTQGGDEALKMQQDEANQQGARVNEANMPPTPEGMGGDVGRQSRAQALIEARNAEHDVIAKNLEETRRATEERQVNADAQNNMDSSPSPDAQAHLDQIAAEEQHRTHLEETHAHALDEQQRLEDAQASVEARQKAIDDSMSGVKSQHEGIRALTAEGGPKTERLAAEADLRARQEAAPTKSKKQLAIEAKASLEADRQRIVNQRAANEEMIQKIRDQHTESEIRTAKAQADAMETIAKRDQANTAATTKASTDAAKARARADALAKDKAKRDKALANIAKQHALQEITAPVGSKERAAAVKAVNDRFSNKPTKVTGGPVKKSVSEPTTSVVPTPEAKLEAKSKEAGLFGADNNGITELHSGLPLPKAVRDRLEGITNRLTNTIANLSKNRPGVQNTFAKNYVGKAFAEAKDTMGAVGSSKTPDQIIAEATRPGVTDIPLDPNSKTGAFSTHMQSGLNSAASKWHEHPVLRGIAGIFDNGLAKSNYQIQKIVQPITKVLSGLNAASMIRTQGALRLEATTGKVFSEAELRAAGMTDKEINAYQLQREAYNSAYELQNEQLKAMKQDTISKKDYYYASRWSGDWHTAITKTVTKTDGTEGKQLVWYIRSGSESEGKRAVAYLKNKFPDLNIDDTTRPQYKGDLRNPDVPRDTASAYRDMMNYFKDDPEMSGAIKQAMEAYAEDKGMANLGQNKHFLDKAGVRGFIGDKPWLSDKENAYQGAKSQVDYLKNAIKWANNQEVIANTTKVLTHPDIAGTNAAALGQAFLNREMGLNTNVVAPIENFLAKSFGVSRNSLLRGIGDTKMTMYLQTLGFNPMYSLATPLQVFASGPMWHMVMSQEGHSVGAMGALKTMALGMTDGTAGIMAHMAHESGAASLEHFINNSGMTTIGKDALRYAENSGFIKRNIFDESRSVGEHGPMDKLKSGMGWTIGQPERIARLTSFMSFVHHLDQAGSFHGDNMALFHEAETYADRTVGSFKSYDRPLAIDKLGSVGQTGYVYQSFKFSSFHTQNAAWRMAARGNWAPIAMLYAGYGLTMGAMQMPGMQEVDGVWNAFKDMISKHQPDLYIHLKDMDIRTGLLNMLPDTKVFREMSARSIAMNGLGGELSGLAVGPHGSSQVLDTEHLMNNLPGSVFAQEVKEWGSVANWLNHPNMDTFKEAIYKNVPPSGKGFMEQNISGFKSGNNPGNQAYFNPNQLSDPKLLPYRRTENDEAARGFGATTTREGNLKETWFRNEQEDARIKQALSSNIVNLLSGIKRGDPADMRNYAQAYIKLDPEGKGLDSALSQGLVNQHMTPYEQRIASKNAKMLVLESLKRFGNAPK